VPSKDKVQLNRAKAMRAEMTEPEKRLWHCIRAKRLNGVKFTHQVLTGPFILDFAARMHKLAIELDGESHGYQVEYDKRRTGYLERLGWRVLRFTNYDVMTNIEGVLETIMQALNTASLPGPLPEGEREI
jgi:very-short-patch-repair endonuclease